MALDTVILKSAPSRAVGQGSGAAELVCDIQHAALRAFMKAVVLQPEVRDVLELRRPTQGTARQSDNQHEYGADCLHATAKKATKAVATAAHREVVYVATVLQGCKELLQPSHPGGCSPDNLLFTVVLRALHRLEDDAPRHGRFLRLCMGWGNDDEAVADDIEALRKHIRSSVRRALFQRGTGA